MSLISRGMAALAARQQRAAAPAGTLTYRRHDAAGAVAWAADLTGRAWVGRTVFRRSPLGDAGGAAVVFGDRDYLIPAECFAHVEGFEPQRGDRVIEQVGGETLTFEVMSLPDEPEYRWSDPGRTVYRVHVKQVA